MGKSDPRETGPKVIKLDLETRFESQASDWRKRHFTQLDVTDLRPVSNLSLRSWAQVLGGNDASQKHFPRGGFSYPNRAQFTQSKS